MIFRKALQEDQQAILSLFHQASTYFNKTGIDQWQDGYPNLDNIIQDQASQNLYVIVDHQEIIGCETISFAADENYKKMIEGQWLTEGPYGVIHRIAISDEKKGQGVARLLLEEAIQLCKQHGVWSIKIDTHQDNQSMRRFLVKNGFQYCGIIQLQRDKTYRVAYEKLICE